MSENQLISKTLAIISEMSKPIQCDITQAVKSYDTAKETLYAHQLAGFLAAGLATIELINRSEITDIKGVVVRLNDFLEGFDMKINLVEIEKE